MAELETLLMYPLSTDLATQEELQAAMSSKADYADFKELSNDFYTVISGAPAAFDTLKEIADWILSDQTSSSKLISDVVELQKDVRYISNDLSIDVSRVTMTEDDGYEKGALLGTVTNQYLNNPGNGPTNGQNASNDSMCFPLYVLSDYGWELSDVASRFGIYDSENDDWLSAFETIWGLGHVNNGNQSIKLSTVTGNYKIENTNVPVTGYWDSTYQATSGGLLWCTTQNDPSTAEDGAPQESIGEKLLDLAFLFGFSNSCSTSIKLSSIILLIS